METPSAQSKKTQLQKITAAELAKVLEQAREESWTALSFISPQAAGWDRVVRALPPGSVYVVEALPKELVRIIPRMTKLSSLGLVDLEIGDEDARSLASLSALTSLDLSGNQIGDEGARALVALSSLTSLSLFNNQIGAEGARSLASLSSLTSLHLFNNQIGDEGARSLASLSALTSLDLSGNQIGAEGARALAALSSLTSLDLSANRIGDEGAWSLASLSALTSLGLYGSQIGDEGAGALASLTALTSLDFSYNQIGDGGARALLETWIRRPTAENLSYLDLRGNGDLSSLFPGETLDTTDAQSILAAYRQALQDAGIPPKRPSEAAAKSEDAPKSTPSAPLAATVPPETIGRPNVRAEEPAETDRLGRQDLVEALGAMFEDPKQHTPVTLALLGDWGAGKSTVMGLLRKRLENGEKQKFRFVDFNAWEYEHTKNMPAALAQATVEGLTYNKGTFKKLWLRVRFAFKQHRGVLSTHIFFFAVATVGCLLLGRNLPGLLPENVPNENAVAQGALWLLGAGGARIYLGYFVWILRGLRRGYQHPLSVQLRTYLSLPKYGEHLGLIPVLKDHISTLCQIELGTRKHPKKRMVVFVDDLDRCEPASIRKTLDALRLVMSIQQVIILIGVDHRIALNAVAQQYKDLAKGHRTKEDIARDYLGKIIQIPIRLERPSDVKLLKFTDQVLFEGVRQTRDKPNRPVAASTPQQSKPQAAGDDE